MSTFALVMCLMVYSYIYLMTWSFDDGSDKCRDLRCD